MILVAISFPLGILCLYLGCLGWRKNQVASAVLLFFSVMNLAFALAVTTVVVFFSQQLGFL